MREIGLAKLFYRAMLVMDVLASAATPFLPGPLWLRAMTGGVGVFGVLVLVAGLRLANDPVHYTRRIQTLLGVTCMILGVTFVYYLGLFSASSTIFAVAIYFFASTLDRRGARIVYATCAVLYFAFTAAIAADLWPDLSLFSAKDLPATSRWYRVVIQQVMYAVTYYLARGSKRSVEIALARIQGAERVVRQRDAQLAEARVDLDMAKRAGETGRARERLGKYELGHLLGRGAMGEVYAARNTETNEPVAIKLLLASVLAEADLVERFFREARAASQVPSPYVAQVYEMGKSSRGEPFIVMELLEGHDLAHYLRKTPMLPLAQVVEMVEQCASALSGVRDAGVVHRDLKPGNVFLTDSLPRKWKVVDFGLSKIHGTDGLTKDQALGTPAYMAPEQVRAGPVDHLADLYGLAAIAYRALTGRAPFSGDQISHILLDAVRRMPPHPGELVKLPVETELVLAIGLAKRKEDRFARVEDFAAAFARAATGNLDDETRQRGWTLVKQYPWGRSVAGRGKDAAR